MKFGIIVSIQGYSKNTTEELCKEIISAGAIGIRTDKNIRTEIDIIGLHKVHVNNPEIESYITNTIELIDSVSEWSQYVAVDYRKLNPNLQKISDFAKEKKIKIIADIGTRKDYENIKNNDYYYTYIATTFSVFNPRRRFYPDLGFMQFLAEKEKNVIAEGNINTRDQVRKIIEMGITNICIGAAISNIYKLTKKFTSILGEKYDKR